MEASPSSLKIRSKSAIKIVSRSIKKTETSETFGKVIKKFNSVIKVYGRLPITRRFKSSRESQPSSAAQQILFTPNSNIFASSNVMNTVDKSTQRTAEKRIEKERIMYDILKAKSDKLELARDLGTFEYNFCVQNQFDKGVANIKQEAYNILNGLGEYYSGVPSKSGLVRSIKEAIKDRTVKVERSEKSFGIAEGFRVGVKKIVNLVEDYKGVVVISGVRCVIYIKSRLTTHSIKCFTEENFQLYLTIEKDLTESLNKSNNSYKQSITSQIISKLYLTSSTSEGLCLHYSEENEKSFMVVILKLKGCRELLSVLIKEFEESFKIEISNTTMYLIQDKLAFGENLLNYSQPHEAKKILKDNLFIHHNRLVWGKCPFNVREVSSKLLKDQYLLEAFNDYLKKIFSIRALVLGRSYKIEGYESQRLKHLKIFSSKNSITLQENSKEFRLLFSLQSLDFCKDFITLSKSIELQIVLNRIFKLDS